MTYINRHSALPKIMFTVLTQFLSLLLSFVTAILLPKFLGAEQYGYYNVFLLYLGYVNLLGLGANDGIALHYGGQHYSALPVQMLRTVNRLFALYIVLLTGIALLVVTMLPLSDIYRFIFFALACNIPVICFFCMLATTFLACGKVYLYNIVNILSKILFSATFLIYAFVAEVNYQNTIALDTLSRIIVVAILIVLGRTLIFGTGNKMNDGLCECQRLIGAGFWMMLSAILCTTIPFVGRIIIQQIASIYDYGIYSFGQSLINLLMGFVVALGTVLYPIIKKMDVRELKNDYRYVRIFVNTIVLMSFLFYPILTYLLKRYMSEYALVLNYLPWVWITCLPLAQNQLLVIPCGKALRSEKSLFVANVYGVVIATVSGLTAYSVFGSVTSLAVALACALSLWVRISEVMCIKKQGGQIGAFPMEMVLAFAFAGLYTFFSEMVAFTIYLGLFALYVVNYRSFIMLSMQKVKLFLLK